MKRRFLAGRVFLISLLGDWRLSGPPLGPARPAERFSGSVESGPRTFVNLVFQAMSTFSSIFDLNTRGDEEMGFRSRSPSHTRTLPMRPPPRPASSALDPPYTPHPTPPGKFPVGPKIRPFNKSNLDFDRRRGESCPAEAKKSRATDRGSARDADAVIGTARGNKVRASSWARSRAACPSASKFARPRANRLTEFSIILFGRVNGTLSLRDATDESDARDEEHDVYG